MVLPLPAPGEMRTAMIRHKQKAFDSSPSSLSEVDHSFRCKQWAVFPLLFNSIILLKSVVKPLYASSDARGLNTPPPEHLTKSSTSDSSLFGHDLHIWLKKKLKNVLSKKSNMLDIISGILSGKSPIFEVENTLSSFLSRVSTSVDFASAIPQESSNVLTSIEDILQSVSTVSDDDTTLDSYLRNSIKTLIKSVFYDFMLVDDSLSAMTQRGGSRKNSKSKSKRRSSNNDPTNQHHQASTNTYRNFSRGTSLSNSGAGDDGEDEDDRRDRNRIPRPAPPAAIPEELSFETESEQKKNKLKRSQKRKDKRRLSKEKNTTSFQPWLRAGTKKTPKHSSPISPDFLLGKPKALRNDFFPSTNGFSDIEEYECATDDKWLIPADATLIQPSPVSAPHGPLATAREFLQILQPIDSLAIVEGPLSPAKLNPPLKLVTDEPNVILREIESEDFPHIVSGSDDKIVQSKAAITSSQLVGPSYAEMVKKGSDTIIEEKLSVNIPAQHVHSQITATGNDSDVRHKVEYPSSTMNGEHKYEVALASPNVSEGIGAELSKENQHVDSPPQERADSNVVKVLVRSNTQAVNAQYPSVNMDDSAAISDANYTDLLLTNSSSNLMDVISNHSFSPGTNGDELLSQPPPPPDDRTGQRAEAMVITRAHLPRPPEIDNGPATLQVTPLTHPLVCMESSKYNLTKVVTRQHSLSGDLLEDDTENNAGPEHHVQPTQAEQSHPQLTEWPPDWIDAVQVSEMDPVQEFSLVVLNSEWQYSMPLAQEHGTIAEEGYEEVPLSPIDPGPQVRVLIRQLGLTDYASMSTLTDILPHGRPRANLVDYQRDSVFVYPEQVHYPDWYIRQAQF